MTTQRYPVPCNMRREAFVKNVENPACWFFTAKVLESAAADLSNRMVSAATKMTPGVVPEDAVWFLPAFHLLAGYAVENAAKALLVKRKRLKVQGDKLPNELGRHGTEKLLKECGVALSPEEVELVRQLDMAVKWAGRYPVPKDAQKMEIVRGTGSAVDRRVLRDLVAKIEGLLKAKGTP